MGKRDYSSFDVMLPQAIRSRFDKAVKALDAADDLLPTDGMDGSSADLRQVLKHLGTAQENLSELMAYRKMLGVD